MKNSARKKRMNDAVKYLISVGLIDGKSTSKSIALKLNRNSTNISSALRGNERYLNQKFIRDFCATYGNIISEDWLWDGTGDMLNSEANISETKEYVGGVTQETPRMRLEKLKDWLLKNDQKCKHNESEILRRLGLGMGYFATSGKQENKTLRESTYKKIGEAWPSVNLVWLRTGIGNMFNDSAIIEESQTNGIPYFDVDFLGGFNEMVNDQTTIPAYYIDFQPYNKKGNMWLNITGDSMAPRINSGDKICIRKIEVEDIIFGEIYAIVTKSGLRTVKWVTRSPEKDMIRLVPENKDMRYGDFQDINKSDILNVFKLIGAIRSF